MGAEVFVTKARGRDADDAFRNAVMDAEFWSGREGYTGTIAEKQSFVMVECPPGTHVESFIDSLIDQRDERIDDKWGPAGCIELKPGEYIFFGWASS